MANAIRIFILTCLTVLSACATTPAPAPDEAHNSRESYSESDRVELHVEGGVGTLARRR